METDAVKHWIELRESCGRVGEKIDGVRAVKDITRRPTESTNLGSQSMNHQPKSIHGLELPTKEYNGHTYIM
jgi:RNA 3'-terminal phosphate cyclase